MLGLEEEKHTWDREHLDPCFVAINTVHVELFCQMTGITELVVLKKSLIYLLGTINSSIFYGYLSSFLK